MTLATPGSSSESERVLIVTPWGRDASIASAILEEADRPLLVCPDLPCLIAELGDVGVALIAEEALQSPDYPELVRCIEQQQPWSDLPVV